MNMTDDLRQQAVAGSDDALAVFLDHLEVRGMKLDDRQWQHFLVLRDRLGLEDEGYFVDQIPRQLRQLPSNELRRTAFASWLGDPEVVNEVNERTLRYTLLVLQAMRRYESEFADYLNGTRSEVTSVFLDVDGSGPIMTAPTGARAQLKLQVGLVYPTTDVLPRWVVRRGVYPFLLIKPKRSDAVAHYAAVDAHGGRNTLGVRFDEGDIEQARVIMEAHTGFDTVRLVNTKLKLPKISGCGGDL